MSECDECGEVVRTEELDGYLRCLRCHDNWESSQEDAYFDGTGALSLDEAHLRAWYAKEGR